MDTRFRDDVQSYLESLIEEELINRRSRLIYMAEEKVIWKNCGSIVESMRKFISDASILLRGISMNKDTNMEFCKILIGNLPPEFRLGSVKSTQSEKGWRTWSAMKEF